MSELKRGVSCFKEWKREKADSKTQILAHFCCSSLPCEVMSLLWSLSLLLGSVLSFFPSRLAGNTCVLLLRMSQHHLYWWLFSLEIGTLRNSTLFEPWNHWLFYYHLILCFLDENCEDILHNDDTQRGKNNWNVFYSYFKVILLVFAFSSLDSDVCKHDFLNVSYLGLTWLLNVCCFLFWHLWHVSNYFHHTPPPFWIDGINAELSFVFVPQVSESLFRVFSIILLVSQNG